MNNNKKSRTAATVTAERAVRKRHKHKIHINYITLFKILQVAFFTVFAVLLTVVIAIYATAPEPQYKAFKYNVSSGDTLWSIAKRFKPENVTMQDYMGWVYEHNDGGIIYPGDVVIMAQAI